MNKVKKSFLPFGIYFLRKVVNYCVPSSIIRADTMKLASKPTILLSNLPGPNPTYKFNGARITKCMFLLGSLGNLTTSLTFFSINGCLK